MPAPSANEFRADFPEFPETKTGPDGNPVDVWTDAKLAPILAAAYQIHALEPYLTKLLAAHLATLDAEAVSEADYGSGEIKHEEAGPRKVDYVTMARDGGEAFYTRSSYGRMFLAMENRMPAKRISARVY